MRRFFTLASVTSAAQLMGCASSESSPNAGGFGGAGGVVLDGAAATGGSTVDASTDAGSMDAGMGGFVGEASDGKGGGGTIEGAADAPQCAPPTPEGTCDSFPQCGCGVGDKCEVTNLMTGRTQCVADGTVVPAHACSSFLGLSCLAGSICLFGACKPYCEQTSDCLGAFQECVPIQAQVAGMDVTVPGSRACTAGCDPVAPGDVCGPDLNCIFIDTVTECIVAGTGVGAGACDGGGLCAPGHTCVNDFMAGTLDCLPWCRIGNPNDCNGGAGEACTPLDTSPTFNGTQYGVCVSP